MSVLLGVDTGGTYTDAVLIADDRVLASAKSLTTRDDLARGIGGAVRAVLARAGVPAERITMASLSTTLATNALVEGQGGRAALVYIGFRDSDLDRQGLRDALGGDPVMICAGGHEHGGSEARPLDTEGLRAFARAQAGQVSAFAVAAQFAVRNPAHEEAAAALLAAETGLPVTASHQLSARLNGPKRALTALLNARLVGMIGRLIERAGAALITAGIDAPLMVVRGDGALMSAAQARMRPIETILSGPAASLVGAGWLTGVDTALVSDIGGTTTDVALLRAGRPAIDPLGARVGPHRTMVEAVAMRTTGLGGDSEVVMRAEGLIGGVTLGPRRVVPVSLLAHEAPGAVLPVLEAQGRSQVPGSHDGRFVRAVAGLPAEGIGPREAALLGRIGARVWPLGGLLRTRMDEAALRRLTARGLIQIAGLTPSDAAHALGLSDAWDAEAARGALELMARRRGGNGNRLAADATQMARIIVDQLASQTVDVLLEAAFSEESEAFDGAPDTLARHELMRRGLASHRGVLALDAGLNIPVVGLGASASSYYPAVGRRLRCEMILPEHADVANAIGAVVGQITVRRSGAVTAPSEGRFRAHLPDGPQDFTDAEAALCRLEEHLNQTTQQAALTAGAADIRLHSYRDVKTARVEARDVFVEAQVTVEASGRPRMASG